MESIGDIKTKIAETPDEALPEIISIYSADERGGVQKLVESAR